MAQNLVATRDRAERPYYRKWIPPAGPGPLRRAVFWLDFPPVESDARGNYGLAYPVYEDKSMTGRTEMFTAVLPEADPSVTAPWLAPEEIAPPLVARDDDEEEEAAEEEDDEDDDDDEEDDFDDLDDDEFDDDEFDDLDDDELDDEEFDDEEFDDEEFDDEDEEDDDDDEEEEEDFADDED